MIISDFDSKTLVAKSADESFYVVRWGSVWFYVIEDHKTRQVEQRCGGLYKTKSAYMQNAVEKAESYDFLESEIVDTFPRFHAVRLTEEHIAALGYLSLQAETPHAIRRELNEILKQVI